MPIAALALAGFAIACYLAMYQWRVIGTVWDPFFGAGSREILRNSGFSRLLPVPDAALGAVGYLLDAVSGVIGGRQRWQRMPWIVVLFGLAVGPLGAVSIMLVILQPVAYGHFCTLCLVSAAISVAMIGPAMDEFLASAQLLTRERAAGRSWWQALWSGPTPRDAAPRPVQRRAG